MTRGREPHTSAKCRESGVKKLGVKEEKTVK